MPVSVLEIFAVIMGYEQCVPEIECTSTFCVFSTTKQCNKMDGTLIGVIREQSTEEDIRSNLGRRTVPGRIFKLKIFMTCTADQKLFGF